MVTETQTKNVIKQFQMKTYFSDFGVRLGRWAVP